MYSIWLKLSNLAQKMLTSANIWESGTDMYILENQITCLTSVAKFKFLVLEYFTMFEQFCPHPRPNKTPKKPTHNRVKVGITEYINI